MDSPAPDFTLTFTAQQLLGIAGSDRVTLFDAMTRQLGLTLESKSVRTPVIVIENVDRLPPVAQSRIAQTRGTQNHDAAPLEFEAVEIKPSEPGTQEQARFLPGGKIDFRAVTLKTMIELAWNFHSDDWLIGMPKDLGDQRFSVYAKAPASTQSADPTKGPPMDIDALRLMMRAMLIDRFKMVTHNEDRLAPVYVLVAAKPKLTRADPDNRSSCKTSVGNAGSGSTLVSTFLYVCTNTTMIQFAAQLQQTNMGDVIYPVIDATGLDGAWDFTLTWTPRSLAARIAIPASENASASDPGVGYTLSEAVEKQLGLRLLTEKRLSPVLVIDHIELKPSDN